MASSKQQTPLIIEQHPKNYDGFPFITLIQYHRQPLLCVVDNMTSATIRVFVLDMCGPAGVNEEAVVMAAQDWFAAYSSKYPVSVHFSRLGITHETSKIFKTLDIEHVTRAVGPVPKYAMDSTKSVKRRKRQPIPLIAVRNDTV